MPEIFSHDDEILFGQIEGDIAKRPHAYKVGIALLEADFSSQKMFDAATDLERQRYPLAEQQWFWNIRRALKAKNCLLELKQRARTPAENQLILLLAIRFWNLRAHEVHPHLAVFGDVWPAHFALGKVAFRGEAKETWMKLVRAAYDAIKLQLVAEAAGERVSEISAHNNGNAMLSPADLAEKFHVPLDSVKKALARWRAKNAGGDGYVENMDARRTDPQFLYKLGMVSPVLLRLSSLRRRREGGERVLPPTGNISSHERPAKK